MSLLRQRLMPESLQLDVIPSDSVRIWRYAEAPDVLRGEMRVHRQTPVTFMAYIPAAMSDSGIADALPHKVQFQTGDGSMLLYW